MSTITAAVARRIASTDRLKIGGITARLAVFAVALATWVLIVRNTRDVGEQFVVSIIVLVGFAAFTSAVNDILQFAMIGKHRSFDRRAEGGSSSYRDDPETLASILVAHMPSDIEMLTLGHATRLLVQQVGPLPISQVERSLDVLTRLQWCAPDFDERSEQRCWRLTTSNVTLGRIA